MTWGGAQASPARMALNENKQAERKVCVYDRPASADRPRALWVTLILIAVSAVAGGLYFFWRS